jgi:tRNA-specific 2-thiouridylase
MKSKKPKVLVAMSGGVDSSVTALLIKKQGYDAVGAYIKSWSRKKPEPGERIWTEERDLAKQVAEKIVGIPFTVLNIENDYKKNVIDAMVKKYRKGITPNPDVDCNEKVKFPLLLKAMKKLKTDYIATGHYIRIKRNKDGKCDLYRAKDETKDQSYFLYRLNQDKLKNAMFPLGNYTKKEVRKMAEKNNFPKFPKSGGGICAVGKINMKKFLLQRIKSKPGKILNPERKEIGTHDGVYYYTIGQRIGPRFGIDLNRGKVKQIKKWYVARKILKTNTLIAAPENHPLNFRKEITLNQPHWINEIPKSNMKILSRIRHVGELFPSTLTFNKNKYKITLSKPITGVSEGQAIVLYEGKKVLGGGVISFT